MSRFAPHKPEAVSGLLFEQSLDLELGFGGAGKGDSQMQDGLTLWSSSLERGLDEHESRASQDAVDKKEIVEPVRMYRRNPPPFHCTLPPALFVGARIAQQYATTALVPSASELSTDTWEKAAFRIRADVSFREQQKLSKNSLLVLREVSR